MNKRIIIIGFIISALFLFCGLGGYFLNEYNNIDNEYLLKLKEQLILIESSYKIDIKNNKMILKQGNNKEALTYNLNKEVLSVSFDNNKTNIDINNQVINAVNIVNGYEKNIVLDTLNTDLIYKYTISDGLTVTKNNNTFNYKISTNNKLKLVDTYITTSYFENWGNYLESDNSLKLTIYNIEFYKYTVNNIDYIVIAENNNLTNNSYKSLLSYIEFKYGTNEC